MPSVPASQCLRAANLPMTDDLKSEKSTNLSNSSLWRRVRSSDAVYLQRNDF